MPKPDHDCLRCERTMSLRLDARPVDPDDLAHAEEHLAHCADCREAARTFAELSELLREMPAPQTAPDFTDRVIAGWRERRSAGAEILPFVRRLVAAAAVALFTTGGWQLARPSVAFGEDALERQVHWVDVIQRGPFEPVDVADALPDLLRDETPEGALERRARGEAP